jgi:thiamine biosynthesis lipoprotein
LYLGSVLRSFLKTCHAGRVIPLILLALLSVNAAPVGLCAAGEADIVRARWLMGTVLEVRFPAGTGGADDLAEAAFREVSGVEAAASLWRPGTELQEVHGHTAAGETVVLSETLGQLVEAALRAAELTGGAYSPAVGALIDAYDLRGYGRWPSEADRNRAASLARPKGVRYDPGTRALRLAEGVTLDLDGIAKGFALDRAAAALRARGVAAALLNFGGQLLSVGPPPGTPARKALVATPGTSGGEALLAVELRDASLSTSADSERVRTIAGREAGHLIDPRSGAFVLFPGSVSVLAATGALADALSTAWAVEGPGVYRRSDAGSPLRAAGAVAFILETREGRFQTLSDAPFERLRPPPLVAGAACLHP